MKILNKKILNKAATFLLTAVLLCWNALQVEAYTALDGYPFVYTNMFAHFFNDSLGLYSCGVLQEQNSYCFDLSDIANSNNSFYELRFGNNQEVVVFPYQPDLYDYYCVGTFAFENNDVYDFTFEPDVARTIFVVDDILNAYNTDFNLYPFESFSLDGYSFSMYLNLGSQSALSGISFIDAESGTFGDKMYFSASIVPVPKASEAEQLNQSILNELIKINQNLVTSNSLQQSTIDAINQHDANEKSWFQQLIQNMGLGFSALYKQMTEEKDEQLYGYQDTTTSEAASAFSSESDKLTALEGELSTQSNTYVSDYASEGFDLGVLATIGSSLIFVTTWFTNFWNMGGVFTAALNFCFALSIVFFILRIKR